MRSKEFPFFTTKDLIEPTYTKQSIKKYHYKTIILLDAKNSF